MSGTDRVALAINRAVPIKRTARVMQVEGIFDIPPSEQSKQQWSVVLPLDERPWNIGLIQGPSGSGKTTIAKEAFGDAYVPEHAWDDDASVVDGFPAAMGAKEITLMLSSVGFSSPPSWLRPYRVLSTGEQFRVSLARTLAEYPGLAVVDEFTSVIDRTVAQIGSATVAKAVRRRGGQFVAVTCHPDVEAWLDPDWTYSTADHSFAWRLLRGRPPLTLEIARVHRSAWQLFAHHHYLTGEHNKVAWCFVAFIDGMPVSFQSYLTFVGRLGPHGGAGGMRARRGHRAVTLPDYQGVGLNNAMKTTLASMWKGMGFRVFRNTGHPAEIAIAKRQKEWVMTRAPARSGRDGGGHTSHGGTRYVASFEYIGEAMARAEAEALFHGERVDLARVA
jgi:hypothetical protein